ncbi:hypothetical protein ACSBR1_036264 [Camellia fascicularis]
MPHKVNCGIDYDEDYDVYEDYDYDSDVPENSEAPETKQENITLGVWCCSICTFDNEEGTSACNICGVLRTPLGNACSNGNKTTGPLKFDVPSPYDLVSKGLRLSKVGSKGTILMF